MLTFGFCFFFNLLVRIFVLFCFANFFNIINCSCGVPKLHPLLDILNSYIDYHLLADFKADGPIQSMT